MIEPVYTPEIKTDHMGTDEYHFVTSADLLTGMMQSGEADRRVHMTYEEAKEWLESGLAIVNAAIAERNETLN